MECPDRLKPKYPDMCYSVMTCPVCAIVNNAYPRLPKETINKMITKLEVSI
jgi:hypothetical protein